MNKDITNLIGFIETSAEKFTNLCAISSGNDSLTYRKFHNLSGKVANTPVATHSKTLFSDIKGDQIDIIKEKWYFKFTRRFISILTFIFSKLYFQLKVIDRHKIPESGSFIIAGNHASLLDFPMIFASLPYRIMKDVAIPAAKDFFFENFLTSFLLQASFRVFPLDRYGNFVKGLRLCAQIIKSGNPVVLFPEGGRSTKGDLMKFKPGIGMLSFKLDVPILPVYITGTFEALPKGARFPRPKPIQIHFGNPIYPRKYQEFKDKIPNYDIYQMIISDLRERILLLNEEHGLNQG